MKLFLKYQFSYFVLLFLVFVLPLALFFQFSTYPLPMIQYVFIGVLFCTQYAFFKEAKFRKKVESKVKGDLQEETQKVPSYQLIQRRIDEILKGRALSIGLNTFLILLIMLWFNKFQ